MDRRQFLQRLILGLEEGIERTRFELPHYKRGEIEGYYAQKFLKAMEENLAKTKAELAQLESNGPGASEVSPQTPGIKESNERV